MSQSLGQKTLSGVGVTVVATLVTSGSGLAAQIILGHFLAKEDFAWYAIAISWSAFAVALRNGGTQQILIRSGSRFTELAPPVLRISFILNCALFAGVMLAGAALAAAKENSSIAWLMLCIGLYLPLSTYSPVFQARLASESRFLTLARINSTSAVVRALAAIAFAMAGLGAMSLALPFLLVAACEFIMGRKATSLALHMRKPDPAERSEIFSQARWIMLSALAVALVLNGDYLAIGIFGSASVLADYFFGFQLTAAVAALLTNGIQTVMMPTFVALADDAQRQAQAFSRATTTLMVVSVGGCFLLALIAKPVMHLIWDGKWDGAAIVVQLMALTLPLRLLMPLGRALLESKGLWSFGAALTFADGVGIFCAAAIGAWAGGITEIAMAVAAYRVLSAFAHYCITRSRLGILSLHRALRQLLLPVGCGLGALATAILVQSLGWSDEMWGWIASVASFGLVYAIASYLLSREDCRYLFATMRSSGAAARV